ncbi:MAG: S8 family serine peptidase [Aquincola tertiaricarbonis]
MHLSSLTLAACVATFAAAWPAMSASAAPAAREQRLDVMPSDNRFGVQWWLQAVAAGNTGAAGFTAAWSRSTGAPASGSGPVVAVLDSGITNHPELDARRLPGYDFVSDANYAADGNGRDNDPTDPGDAISGAERAAQPAVFGGCPDAPFSSWHGTVIAGQVAAVSNNGEGVAAANWNGRFLPVRVAGKCGAAVADIVAGLRWAAGLPVAGVPLNPTPARLIVLGYGAPESCDAASPVPEVAAVARQYIDALAEVRAAGALVIAAAGNLRGAVARPASCAGAFAVTALNREGYKANYASFGPQVALATPGGDMAAGNTCDAELADAGIVSTGNLGETGVGEAGYVAASGSSFAGPAVAGAAALMLAVNPALTVAQLAEGLTRSARPHVQVPLLGECSLGQRPGRCSCTTRTCGAGLLDADQALAYAAAPASYAAPAAAPVMLADSRIRACALKLGPLPPSPGASEPVPPPAPAPDGGGGGGGGGALHPHALIGLLLACGLLALSRDRHMRR